MENIEPINEHRERWDEAFERLRMADAACQEYIDATDPLYALEHAFRRRVGIDAHSYRPDYLDRLKALREATPAYFVPELMNDHRDKLVEEFVEVEDELMAMPAPDLSALRWKLAKTAGSAWEEGYLAQMHRDMDRLMGSAPDASAPAKAA